MAPAEVLALAILLTGMAALTAVIWWTNQPIDQAVSPAMPTLSVTPSPIAQSGPVVVDVAGQVLHPGLVTLEAGARVADAIAAAGGLTPQAVTDGLNLARPLSDGEQIVVVAMGEEVVQPTGVAAQPGMTADGLLDLNLATAEQLQQLPGIGPVTAERITSYRDSIGGFSDIAQLLEVPGIGPGRFAELQARVTV